MKESDIRDQKRLNKFFSLMKKDSEDMINDSANFVDAEYKSWGCGKIEYVFSKWNYDYYRCNKTYNLFVHPRPSLKHLEKFYTNSKSAKYWAEEFFPPYMEKRREKIFKPRAKFIAEKFNLNKIDIIGDIGAGFGLFLDELSRIEPKKNYYAIEPSNKMSKICSSKGYNVIKDLLENIDSNNHQFDLLTSFETFEHLQDPKPFVEKAYNLLNRNGIFYLTTLSGVGFDILNLWKDSNSISPPQHLNFFSPSGIKKLFESIGFSSVEVTTPGRLDWDIFKKQIDNNEHRFFDYVHKFGSKDSIEDLQKWISKNNFSSHMCIVGIK
ncbi:MAG: hypothetical protein CMC33_02585 [Flavobacteriaceae bacterium]|nr:hypothetical protein [Flavobacteriaceae bacterium]|tara:strand:+ start:10309 stop:11280 length:972 start_codon:yes stop_codon:yes gene_type:complete